MIGQTLNGRYAISRLLGKGGMGAVFEATQVGSGRRVAVKVIHREHTSESLLARFHREVKVAASVETEHVVQVLDAGTDPQSGSPYMVMELLEGEDLGQLLERVGPIAPEVALRITVQACRGLQKAHEAGVVHRDIKPANLFLTRREGLAVVVKVVDFGIAKLQADHTDYADSSGLTRTGTMLGTPLYMSPEQARGTKNVDHRTDIWSLGVVLFRALAGRAPNADAEAFGDLIVAIIGELPPPVQEFAPWVPPEIAAIVQGALQHDVAERFQSAAAMREAMEKLLPHGAGLHLDMLKPLTEGDRTRVAARSQPTTGGQAPGPRRGDTGGGTAVMMPGSYVTPAPLTPAPANATSGARPHAQVPHPGAEPGRGGETAAPVVQSATLASSGTLTPMAPQQARSKVPLAVAALLATMLGGAAAYVAFARPTPQAETPVAQVSGAIAPSSAPVASVAPAVTPAPSPTRRVRLVVYPSDALVEIEGAPARMRDGIVDIEGTLGSVHRVRLFKGKAEIEADVIITEAGAMPPKLELGASKPLGGPMPKVAPTDVPVKPANTGLPAARKTFE